MRIIEVTRRLLHKPNRVPVGISKARKFLPVVIVEKYLGGYEMKMEHRHRNLPYPTPSTFIARAGGGGSPWPTGSHDRL